LEDWRAGRKNLYVQYIYCTKYARITMKEAREMTDRERHHILQAALQVCKEEADLADRERRDEYSDTMPDAVVRNSR